MGSFSQMLECDLRIMGGLAGELDFQRGLPRCKSRGFLQEACGKVFD